MIFSCYSCSCFLLLFYSALLCLTVEQASFCSGGDSRPSTYIHFVASNIPPTYLLHDFL